MIITITGKPCSGKGTVGKLFCKKFNFNYICTGDMFRALALENGFNDILEFQKLKNIEEFDKIIDDKTIQIGKTKINENIVFDSRLAWHFIPNSFKVFIDVDLDIAGNRLINANRNTEKSTDITSAKEQLNNRWQTENDRYTKLYNTNNLDLNNYDFVISSSNKTPEEIVDEIYKAYKNFIKPNKN